MWIMCKHSHELTVFNQVVPTEMACISFLEYQTGKKSAHPKMCGQSRYEHPPSTPSVTGMEETSSGHSTTHLAVLIIPRSTCIVQKILVITRHRCLESRGNSHTRVGDHVLSNQFHTRNSVWKRKKCRDFVPLCYWSVRIHCGAIQCPS